MSNTDRHENRSMPQLQSKQTLQNIWKQKNKI